MSLFSAAWERLLPASAGHPDVRTANIHEPRPHRPPLMHASQQEWDSTLNTATAITGKVLDWRLGEIQRERAAVAVHYAIGAAVGAAYAAGREYVPQVAAGAGAPFGAGVFLVAQEFGTPRLGLSKAASDYSLPMHANSLGEHVVWGVVTDLVSRALRRML